MRAQKSVHTLSIFLSVIRQQLRNMISRSSALISIKILRLRRLYLLHSPTHESRRSSSTMGASSPIHHQDSGSRYIRHIIKNPNYESSDFGLSASFDSMLSRSSGGTLTIFDIRFRNAHTSELVTTCSVPHSCRIALCMRVSVSGSLSVRSIGVAGFLLLMKRMIL